ncbi:hypothetical protein RJ640_022085 [Escallonia rubra]|uniref:Reverse transcriptase domain-containing protein n=1 Tax=Escallonia rubra TaxID=112253 RepID=A0AA88U993_9ASTE|nr:hypothetical protein RJ640_022085 [Escallonia rubra]
MLCDSNSVTEVNSSSSHDSIIPCAGNIQNCFDSSCLVVELQLSDNDDHADSYSPPSQAPTPIPSENNWFAEDDLWISTHSILDGNKLGLSFTDSIQEEQQIFQRVEEERILAREESRRLKIARELKKLECSVIYEAGETSTESKLNVVDSFIISSLWHGRDIQWDYNPAIGTAGGAKYTWTNNQRNPIMSRLDRFFISADWENHFKNVAQKALPRVISDHSPIILDVNSLRKARTYFKFENMWLENEGFIDLVKNCWSSCNFEGWPSFILAKKLKILKKQLREWSKVEFGNMNSRKSQIMTEIDTLNNKEEELLLSDEDSQRRLSLQLEFHQITKMEEISWRQKSMETWLKLGDENSRYFHMMASMKRRRNFISAIYVDNSRVDDLDTIKSKAVQFYQNLLTERFEHRPLLDGIRFNSLSPEKAANLESPFTEDEVWSAVKGCKADKAPGPDGFNFGFIHARWDIIKFEVLQFVNEFHGRCRFERSLNSTFLVLLQKREGAECLKDFRPISLMSSMYKIISKLLATRISTVMNDLISSSQHAFVKGRQILDAALIANECVDEKVKRKQHGVLCVESITGQLGEGGLYCNDDPLALGQHRMAKVSLPASSSTLDSV